MEELLERIIQLEKRVSSLEESNEIINEVVETDDNDVLEQNEDIKDEEVETEEEKEVIKYLIEMYINDVMKNVDKGIIKELTKEQPDWKEQVENYLDLTKYKIKKFINENKDKEVREVVELLIN
jgi:hypothetical protein